MRLFPVFADLRDRPVLVVGGGSVALRKTMALREAGALVTVGALRHRPELQQLEREGVIVCKLGEFTPEWLNGMWLVIAATNDRRLNADVAEAAQTRHIWCNVVDDPGLSSFQVPSIINREPLVIAVSSSGAAPMLARRVRERIEALFDHSLGELAKFAGRYREAIRVRYADLGQRRRFYDWLFEGPVAGLLRSGKAAEADAAVTAALQIEPMLHGRVVFVGVGPGPAAYLTLQGLRALNQADLILHGDIDAEIVAMARRDATIQQWPAGQDGSALLNYMAREAGRGLCVVHLQRGAPYEPSDMESFLNTLDSHVSFEVVRGIPAF